MSINLVHFCQTEATVFANDHEGGEAVWQVLNRAEEWIRTQWCDIRHCFQQSIQVVQQIKSDDVATTTTTTTTTSDQTSTQIIGRRRDMLRLAKQYNLGGYAKIGWPGIIIIEGQEYIVNYL